VPRLERLQRDFARGIIGRDMVAIAPLIAGAPLGAADALDIYRNHFLITLEDALAATFPSVRALVGEGFFGQVARRFVQASPPESPCLFEYGAAFPDFLEGLPQTRELAYLGDVARLEWAVNLAYHAPDLPALPPERARAAMAAPPGERAVELHPSLRLVRSRYPIVAIWRAAQPDSDPGLRVDLGQGGESLLILRVDDDVAFRPVSEPEACFLSALAEGRVVSQAAEEAGGQIAHFDRLIEALCEAGAFTDVVAPAAPTRE
jgi:hypothetical protein